MTIKEKLLNNTWLKSELKKKNRLKSFVNINNAATIGLIWQNEDIEATTYLIELLQNRNIVIEKLCFANTPGEMVFSKKDFSFFGRPKSDIVKEFINKPFDILIDITKDSTFEIKVIRALSKAKFKVGSSVSDSNYLDLNIQIKGGAKSMYLVEQILFYLEAINNVK
ncbi:MAG: DUF6913 domain-containing protein [Mangrovibacterium sp.]